ncbi:diguanylate cyclase [Saccharospirillum sp.]|uniref:sensor domain-containing diguanylate cyclase n=1 Tax=Saccharospirillum sp. TaxID=2033801 RepID=UPI0034A00FAB
MITPGPTPDEVERLAALRDLNLLDTEPEARFDRITRIAARLFNTPSALISLVDAERLWFKSRHCFEVTHNPRDISFCGHAILAPGLMVVPDTTQDERFFDNPQVTSEPHIRFYAGAPLKAPNGSLVGTLCIIDRVAREFDETDAALLQDLANIAEDELARQTLSTLAIKLHRANQERESLIQASPLAIISYNSDRLVEVWNPAAEQLFETSGNAIVGQPLMELGPRLSSELLTIGDRVKQGESVQNVPLSLALPESAVMHLSVSAAPMKDTEGELSGITLLIADLSEREQLTRELEREHELLKAVLDNVGVGVVACDQSAALTVFNPTASEHLGGPVDIPPDQWAREYQIYDAEGERLLDVGELPLYRALRGERVKDAEIVLRPENKPQRTLLVNGRAFESATGEKLGAVVALHDITQRKEMERALEHQANHDSLTGLPNRAALIVALQQANARAARHGKTVAVLFLDLDDFKTINDTYGHQVGDQALQQFAKRLSLAVREADTVARLAGDEFVVVAEELENPTSDALLIAHKLLASMNLPIELSQAKIDLAPSIGIAMHRGELDAEELVRRADSAMYQAKTQGNSGIQFYQEAN